MCSTTHIQTHTHMYTYMFIHVESFINMYTYAHTHTHAYTQTHIHPHPHTKLNSYNLNICSVCMVSSGAHVPWSRCIDQKTALGVRQCFSLCLRQGLFFTIVDARFTGTWAFGEPTISSSCLATETVGLQKGSTM